MKKIVFDFFRRGIAACGMGPIVLSVLYTILHSLGAVDTLRVDIPTPFDLELKCPHFNANLSYAVSPHYLTCTPTLSFDDSCTTLCATGEAKPTTVDLSEYEQLTFNDLVK